MQKIKYLTLLLLLLTSAYSFAQNNGGALVDKRISLDDDRRDARQSQQPPAQAQPQQPQRHNAPQYQRPGAAERDTLPRIVLPSSNALATVSGDLDSATITVGEQRTLSIIVRRTSKKVQLAGVTFPTLQQLTQGAIEALESSIDTLRDADGNIESLVQSVTITSFEAGHHPVDFIVVAVGTGDNAAALAPAEELWLNVAYSAGADTTKCEMKGDVAPLKEPYTFWEIARWVVLALLVAAVVVAVVWVVKRRSEHKPVIPLPKAKPVPADKRALAELESLRRKELWQKGRIKKYYTDLTDVVRRFLHNMYGISATEMTTRQTLRAFRNIGDWSEESNELLRQLLQKADMVKFAKQEPEAHEHDLTMQCAIDFVRKVAETHKINNPEKEEK